MADPQEADGGLILRGDDGSLYFIRDEVLNACKTEGKYLDRVKEIVDGGDEVEGFDMNLGAVSQFTAFGTVRRTDIQRVDLAAKPVSPQWNAADGPGHTLMCPW